MASSIEIDDSCIPTQPSRVVYIIAPGSLVRLGPDLDGALTAVIASLEAALAGPTKPRHFATTYSLANITIVMDCYKPGEDIQLQVFRLRQSKNKLFGHRDQGLSKRIADQLEDIQLNQPNIQTPFSCIEDWRGYGPKDHHIYKRMVEASASIEAWRKFKDTVRRLLSIRQVAYNLIVSPAARQPKCICLRWNHEGGRAAKGWLLGGKMATLSVSPVWILHRKVARGL